MKTEPTPTLAAVAPATFCSPLLVLPKDACSNESLAELKAAGYIVIRTDSPEKVQLVTPEMVVDHSDMMMSAMKALSQPMATGQRGVFIEELYRRMLKREANATAQATTPAPTNDDHGNKQ